MTIICGYAGLDDETWIGSDSQSSSQSFIFPVTTQKILLAGQWGLGIAGPSFGTQCVAANLDKIAAAATPRDVAFALSEIYRAYGFQDDSVHEKSGAPSHGMGAVLASAGKVWGICSDYAVVVPDNGFWATGAGMDYAFGAAWTMIERGALNSRSIVEIAIRAAIAFRADCGGEIKLVRVKAAGLSR